MFDNKHMYFKTTLKQGCLTSVVGISFLLISNFAVAVESIAVNGIFKDKVVLAVDGKQHILKVGKSTKSGVKLLKVLGDKVTLLVDGKEREFRLGETTGVRTNFKEAEVKEVVLSADQQGHYYTVGAINKRPVRLLVDTGATVIAINSNKAKELGIKFSNKNQQGMVTTASGMTRAYRVVLDTVRVGDITMYNVEAAVIEGSFPRDVLLGMTFLRNLELHRDGEILKIKKKW